jgi:hypothetical protein
VQLQLEVVERRHLHHDVLDREHLDDLDHGVERVHPRDHHELVDLDRPRSLPHEPAVRGRRRPQRCGRQPLHPDRAEEHQLDAVHHRRLPRVSLYDAANHTIGTPATEDTSHSPSPVSLRPGDVASTIVHTLDQGISPQGCWPASTSVRIYPPDETAWLTARGAITVCGGVFTITGMAAGSGV